MYLIYCLVFWEALESSQDLAYSSEVFTPMSVHWDESCNQPGVQWQKYHDYYGDGKPEVWRSLLACTRQNGVQPKDETTHARPHTSTGLFQHDHAWPFKHGKILVSQSGLKQMPFRRLHSSSIELRKLTCCFLFIYKSISCQWFRWSYCFWAQKIMNTWISNGLQYVALFVSIRKQRTICSLSAIHLPRYSAAAWKAVTPSQIVLSFVKKIWHADECFECFPRENLWSKIANLPNLPAYTSFIISIKMGPQAELPNGSSGKLKLHGLTADICTTEHNIKIIYDKQWYIYIYNNIM